MNGNKRIIQRLNSLKDSVDREPNPCKPINNEELIMVKRGRMIKYDDSLSPSQNMNRLMDLR